MRARDLFVISIVVTALLGAGTFIGVVLGGVDPTFPPPREAAFREIAAGTVSGWHDAETFVIRDGAAYDSVLGDAAARDPTGVDFSRRMVLGVALGDRPTGGHAVRFTSVEIGSGVMWVRLESVRPASGCPVTTALTQPYAFVEVDRFDGPVVFLEPIDRAAC